MTHVLIAGGGIAGLAAALALAKSGLDVSIYEKRPDLAPIGAGLQLSPNATSILARLGVLEALSRRASEPSGVLVRSALSGRQLAYMPLDQARERWGAPYLVALRADLHAALLEAVANEPAIKLELDAALAGFGVTDGGVRATIKQGGITRSVTGDALLGADGIHSIVRARLAAGADAPLETGRMAWRALIDANQAPPAVRGSRTGLWLGRDAHLVHYALDGGRRINLVAVVRDAATTEGDMWAIEGEPAAIRRRFAGWHADARDLIAAAPNWTGWPLFDRAPLATWSAGPVALLGDAAHPILPFLAQGAAQAIEDAAAVAAAIATTRDVTRAFALYSQARQSRARNVQDQSRRLGRIYHFTGAAAAGRDGFMRLLGGRRLIQRYDWLYGRSTASKVTATVTGD